MPPDRVECATGSAVVRYRGPCLAHTRGGVHDPGRGQCPPTPLKPDEGKQSEGAGGTFVRHTVEGGD